MELSIFLHRANGMWGWNCEYIAPPAITIDNVNVTIIQNGTRSIRLETNVDKSREDLLMMALNIIKLIQIGEGYFQTIKYVEYTTKDGTILKKSYSELLDDKLIDYFRTYKNFISDKFKLLAPSDIVSEMNYKSFIRLYEDLFIQHNAYLYFCVDNGLPIDLRMANIIELCEPIAEHDRKDTLPKNFSLKDCIRVLVKQYGQLMFKKEIEADIFEFEGQNKNGNMSILQKLVNTRVNILHYKLKPKECFNKGAEMVIYCNKIHLLYRVTMLRLLRLDVSDAKIVEVTEYIEYGMLRDFDFTAFIANY